MNISHFDIDTGVPAGFKTFKCATPGCRAKATMAVEMPHTLGAGRARFFCNSCGHASAQYEANHCGGNGPDCVIESAPVGLHIYRKREDSPGGWRGHVYLVALRGSDICHQIERPNPWALRDGDGNPKLQ